MSSRFTRSADKVWLPSRTNRFARYEIDRPIATVYQIWGGVCSVGIFSKDQIISAARCLVKSCRRSVLPHLSRCYGWLDPISSTGILVCAHWRCPLEIENERRGLRLITCNSSGDARLMEDAVHNLHQEWPGRVSGKLGTSPGFKLTTCRMNILLNILCMFL